jgi:hypothetical protein
VQTASSTMRSQVFAPATMQERAQNEPVETHPNQDALHVASVQAHPDDPKSDIDGDKPGLDGSSPPNDIEDRSAAHASHEMKDHPVSDGKTSTLLRRHAHVHHAGSAAVARHGKWFKRWWDHLAWPRQFRVAFLHVRGGPTMTVMDYWLQSIGVRWLDQARAIGAKLEETGSGR